MAWTAPITWVDGQTVTAAQLNAGLRDNLMQTAPALATAPTTWPRHFASTGLNSIAEREVRSQTVATSQTTTSTSFADLSTVGPLVTLTTGPFALVSISTAQENSNATTQTRASFAISGATTTAASTAHSTLSESAATETYRMGITHLMALTSGSNTFTMQYRVGTGTGTYSERHIVVVGF